MVAKSMCTEAKITHGRIFTDDSVCVSIDFRVDLTVCSTRSKALVVN